MLGNKGNVNAHTQYVLCFRTFIAQDRKGYPDIFAFFFTMKNIYGGYLEEPMFCFINFSKKHIYFSKKKNIMDAH